MELYKKPFIFKDQTTWVLASQVIPLMGLSCIMHPAPFIMGLIACIGHWVGIFIAAYRRRDSATLTDVLFVKLGYLPLLISTPFIAIPVLALKFKLLHR